MDDAAVVRGGESRAELPRELDRAILRQPSDAPQQRRQVLAIDVFHREKRVAFELADVVDAADVRMRHLARHPHFRVQLRQPHWVAIHRFWQELQRDRLSERRSSARYTSPIPPFPRRPTMR